MRTGTLSGIFALSLFLALPPVASAQTTLNEVFVPCFLNNCSDLKGDDSILFARVEVPETRGSGQSNTLSIALMVLTAKTDQPEPDPVVYLSGGPGGEAISSWPSWVNHPIRDKRDIILIDFRGIGYSQPEICPALHEKIIEIFTQDISPEAAINQQVMAYEECWEQLKSDGVDMNSYNTAAVVQDLEEALLQLGYTSWNLFGISYGTRVAQTALRDTPDHIRSVILDSPVGMDMNFHNNTIPDFVRSVDLVAEECLAQPDCNETYGDIRQTLFKNLRELDSEGWGMRHSELDSIYVKAHDLNLALHQLLYSGISYPILPMLIKAVDQRRDTPILNLISILQQRASMMNFGVGNLTNRYDSFAMADVLYFEEQLERFPDYKPGITMFHADYFILEYMESVMGGEEESRPVISDVPALILSGDWDPITPPSNGEDLKQHFPNHIYYNSPYTGHGVSFQSDCGRQYLLHFIDSPMMESTPSCTEKSAPVFITEITEMESLAGFLSDLSDRNIFTILILIPVLILIIAQIIIWPLLRGYWFYKKEDKPVHKLTWLSFAGTQFVTLYFIFIALAVTAALEISPLLLLFGVPSSYAIVSILPWLVTVCSAFLIVMVLNTKIIDDSRMRYVYAAAAVVMLIPVFMLSF
jgi:pimeloyl-ACP methyl ester carboxylesterase